LSFQYFPSINYSDQKQIQTKSTQYLQIVPSKTPDCLLTLLARAQEAFDILEANPNYEPQTARAYFTGALGHVTRVKNLTDIDKCVFACDCALNDTSENPILRSL